MADDSLLDQIRLVAGKDLRVEWRSRVGMAQVVPFAILVLVVFAFALDGNRQTLRQLTGGLYWIAVLFSAVMLVQRAFSVEADPGVREALRLSGLRPAAVFAGKATAIAVQLGYFCPPRYLSGCSQAIWPGDEPLLVRNYDYSQSAFDAVLLKTKWNGRGVIGTSDGLFGLVDGMNDAGLALSLTFGGRREVGSGFGVPLILRYILQTCSTTAEAAKVLQRVPSHMSYNVTVLDADRRFLTAYLAPDRDSLITHAAVATNHQERVEWSSHARFTATVERERYLLQRLTLHPETQERFIGAFLKPPLYSTAFTSGFGTLYTAAYRPRSRVLELHWPDCSWTKSFKEFPEDHIRVSFPGSVAQVSI